MGSVLNKFNEGLGFVRLMYHFVTIFDCFASKMSPKRLWRCLLCDELEPVAINISLLWSFRSSYLKAEV